MTSPAAELTLKEGESNSVTLSLTADATATNKPSANSTAAAATSNPPASMPRTAADGSPNDASKSGSQGSSGLKTGGYIGLSVGAAGVAVGTVFAIRAKSLRTDANDYANSGCTLPNGGCPPQYRPSIDSKDSKADSARNVAVAGFVVGGACVAAGVTMLLVAPSNPSHDSAFVRPYFTTNGAGVYGQF